MKHPAWWGLALLSLLLMSVSSKSQNGAASNVTSKLSLSLIIDKDQYQVNEPLLLAVKVSNIADQPYCEKHVLETGMAGFNGYVLRAFNSAGQPLVRRQQTPSRATRSVTRICIKPGEVMKEIVDVSGLVNISSPGVYSLRVEHIDAETNTLLSSNTTTMTVH